MQRLDSGIRVTTIGEQLFPTTSAFDDHVKTLTNEEAKVRKDCQVSDQTETQENDGLIFSHEADSMTQEKTVKTMRAI